MIKIIKIQKYLEHLQIVLAVKNSTLRLIREDEVLGETWEFTFATSKKKSVIIEISQKSIHKIFGHDFLTRYNIVFDFLDREGEIYFYTLNFVVAHPETKPVLIDKNLLEFNIYD